MIFDVTSNAKPLQQDFRPPNKGKFFALWRKELFNRAALPHSFDEPYSHIWLMERSMEDNSMWGVAREVR